MNSKFGQIGLWPTELAAIQGLKKNPIDLLWEKSRHHNLSAVFDNKSFSYLLVMRTCIRARMW